MEYYTDVKKTRIYVFISKDIQDYHQEKRASCKTIYSEIYFINFKKCDLGYTPKKMYEKEHTTMLTVVISGIRNGENFRVLKYKLTFGCYNDRVLLL